ncbi:hypothetical protein LCGC14_1533190 [marine sediment metagenome]|uniref:Uncharacterized protein n=1 Tax=marine sediment metagenome TaxID=412755 RepID=A0A0F9IVE2_9ZZZZ
MERAWTDDMGEISGFGGSYEESCRAMVLAGIEWLEEHPDASVRFQEIDVISAETDEAKQFLDCLVETAESLGAGPAGAMVNFTTYRAMTAHKFGWEAYQGRMRDRPSR